MKRIFFRSVAASSLLLASVAGAATRPHYGGTLHVAVSASPATFDPADPAVSRSIALRNISRVVFDTLVALDSRGAPRPSLATSWHAESGNQRWEFELRKNISLHDGSALTSDIVAASLRLANPEWKVFPIGDSVSIEMDSPAPDLPVQLALPRNGIARRDGKILGTGPYGVTQWDPGKKLVLSARDDYWGGRAFLDSIEVELGRNSRDQKIELDLGKADMIEIAPDQSRRAAGEGRRVEYSAPIELAALFFARDASSVEEGRLREALSLSIDRVQLSRVLLQGAGEATGSILPNWMTGYSFLFPAEINLARAKQVQIGTRQAAPWTLSYDAGDPLARVVAERIILNARDAGLSVQLTTSVSSDIRLLRMPLASSDASVALAELVFSLKLALPKLSGGSAESLYNSESSLLQSHRIIPVLHLRSVTGLSASVQGWAEGEDGSWDLPEAWLLPAKP